MALGTGALSGLRLAVTSNVPLYSAVCYVKKRWLGQQIDYAHRGTDLCIEGYRSSGNSFATEVVSHSWPSMSLASHRHCVAAVQHALQLGKPVVILTREPEEAISSCVVRFGWPARFAIADYIHFYSRTAAIAGPRYLDFARLLSHPSELLALVHELTGAPLPSSAAALSSEEFRARRTQNMQQWGVTPDQWWIPHPDKERRKHDVKLQLAQHGELLDRARELYSTLHTRQERRA